MAALIHHLGRFGHGNAVACPEGTPLAEKCRSGGVEVYNVRMRNSLDIPSILKLARITSTYGPDVVHLHTSRAHFLGAWSSWISSPPVTIVTRRMSHPPKRPALTRFLYTRMVGRVVAISSGVKEALLSAGIPGERIEVIHSGIDFDRFDPNRDGSASREALGLPGDWKIVGIVASLVPVKGHKWLFSAMEEVLRRFPGTCLLVVGDGPIRTELESAAARTSLAGHVVFTGRSDQVPELLAAMDVLILPSLAEGLGVSILEGMAMGLPVVGTDVGGIPESIRDGVNGFLIPPGDASAIAERLIWLFDNPGPAERMGQAGRALVEQKFTSSIMARRNEDLYVRLLSKAQIHHKRDVK